MDEHVVDVGSTAFFDAHAGAGISLRITVDQKNAFSGESQRSTEIDTTGCLSHSALLVGECNDFCHRSQNLLSYSRENYNSKR